MTNSAPTLHHRWNVEDAGDGRLRVCFGHHERDAACDWQYFVPASTMTEMDKELAKARQDSDRLDWLAGHMKLVAEPRIAIDEWGCTVIDSDWEWGEGGPNISIREAIDTYHARSPRTSPQVERKVMSQNNHLSSASNNRDISFNRLRDFIQEHQVGGCKWLSEGTSCKCALCDLDRLNELAYRATFFIERIAVLRGSLARLKRYSQTGFAVAKEMLPSFFAVVEEVCIPTAWDTDNG